MILSDKFLLKMMVEAAQREIEKLSNRYNYLRSEIVWQAGLDKSCGCLENWPESRNWLWDVNFQAQKGTLVNKQEQFRKLQK